MIGQGIDSLRGVLRGEMGINRTEERAGDLTVELRFGGWSGTEGGGRAGG